MRVQLSELSSEDVVVLRRGELEFEAPLSVVAGYISGSVALGGLVSEANATGVGVVAGVVDLLGWTGLGPMRLVSGDEVKLTVSNGGVYRVDWQVSGSVDVGVVLGLSVDGVVVSEGYQVADGIWMWGGVVELSDGAELKLVIDGAGVGTFVMESGWLGVLRV